MLWGHPQLVAQDVGSIRVERQRGGKGLVLRTAETVVLRGEPNRVELGLRPMASPLSFEQ